VARADDSLASPHELLKILGLNNGPCIGKSRTCACRQDFRARVLNQAPREPANHTRAPPSNYVHCGYTHTVNTDAESLLPLPSATLHMLNASSLEPKHVESGN
jgi:hypothetical protein